MSNLEGGTALPQENTVEMELINEKLQIKIDLSQDEEPEYQLNHSYLLGFSIALSLPACIGLGTMLAEMS